MRALTRLGYRPCVFALDHDRAVHDTFPHLLQITLVPIEPSVEVLVGDGLADG